MSLEGVLEREHEWRGTLTQLSGYYPKHKLEAMEMGQTLEIVIGKPLDSGLIMVQDGLTTCQTHY